MPKRPNRRTAAPTPVVDQDAIESKPSSWEPSQQMILSPSEKLRYQLLVARRESESLKTEIRRRDADKLLECVSHLGTQKKLLMEQALTAQLRAQLACKELDDQITVLSTQRKDALSDAEKKSTFTEDWRAVSEDVKRRLGIPAGYSMSIDMETGTVSTEQEAV